MLYVCLPSLLSSPSLPLSALTLPSFPAFSSPPSLPPSLSILPAFSPLRSLSHSSLSLSLHPSSSQNLIEISNDDLRLSLTNFYKKFASEAQHSSEFKPVYIVPYYDVFGLGTHPYMYIHTQFVYIHVHVYYKNIYVYVCTFVAKTPTHTHTHTLSLLIEQLVMTLSTPCYQKPQNLLGVASVDLKVSDMFSNAEYFTQGDVSYAFVIDQDG